MTYLNVGFGPQATRKLFGDIGVAASRLLSAIADDIDLWDADDQTLKAAQELWTLLGTRPGVGPVTAGKLLARKRPRLIPVADEVVLEALNPAPGRLWITLRSCLNIERRAKADALRPQRCHSTVSTLRLIDTAIWMRCSRGRNAKLAQATFGLT